ATDVLPAHAQHVALALRSIEAQGKRQPRLASDRVALFKLRDFAFGPAVMALALALVFLDAGGRVCREHALADGIVENDAQRLEQMVCRLGLVCLGTDHGSDVLALETFQRLAPMRLTKRLDDVPARRLRARPQAAEVR